MVRLKVRRHKHRAGWGLRLYIGPRFLDVAWFHHAPVRLP